MCHLKVKSESHHMHGSDHDSKHTVEPKWNFSVKTKAKKKEKKLEATVVKLQVI